MIEFKIQSVILQDGEIQGKFPDLVTMINSYLPKRKTHQKRTSKKNRSAGDLINEIIADVEGN